MKEVWNKIWIILKAETYWKYCFNHIEKKRGCSFISTPCYHKILVSYPV